ncbi:MAG TPA: NADH-quinone oxidoreductase subunit L [Syntrophobacter fumaroxidans]|nr:NADH-quinone oxidoreductase subunit L [Syntrophobacter fumaroxidans]
MSPLQPADMTLTTAVLTTVAPFVSFLLIMLLTRSRPRLSAGLSIGAVTVSLVGAVVLLCLHWHTGKPVQYTTRWMISGDMGIPVGYLLDPVSLLMLLVVAAVSFLIQVYSLGYMAGDTGFSRYFAFMSLFVWAMMCLVISPTLFQLYVFWELVGLSSYLLIGFWYRKFSASQAGKKAFVMTRAGDVALFIGMLLVLLYLGNLNILEIDGPEMAQRMPPNLLTLSAVLIFGGIIGKSAQFPLMTWLPDAMEGPAPVSALLHSSTMVAAGVYLFERLFPFFLLSPVAMTVGLTIGTVSMLLASTMAMVSRDIKQIWAYSTISQLGFMIMGLDAGSLFSGVFHLTTHAGFKALLFLCAGVFIHRHQTNDIFELSRLGARSLKAPMVCTVIAVGSLAGLPPLSGFFSKEVILAGLGDLANPMWLTAALLGVFLTAYYGFRLVFILLFPREPAERAVQNEGDRGSEAEHGHGGTAHWLMTWPLIVLAAATVLLGFLEKPLERFLLGGSVPPGIHSSGYLALVPCIALALALAGMGLAWVEFGRRSAPRVGFVERVPALRRLFAERWYIDHFYRLVLDRLIDRGIARLFQDNDDKVIDGGIDGLCRGTVFGGRLAAALQSGMIQYRLLTTFVVMVMLAVYFFL